MKLAKWGNSLALRIPADVVSKLGIAPNEEVEIKITGESSFEVSRDRRRQEAIESIRRMARPFPPGFKFNRDEIYDRYERSVMGRNEADVDPKKEQEAQ